MTLQEYHDKLEGFDWFYDQIDHHATWKSHFDYHSRLIAWSRISEDHGKLFEAHQDHVKNGGPRPSKP